MKTRHTMSLFSNPSPLPVSIQKRMLFVGTYPADTSSSPIPLSHLSYFSHLDETTGQEYEMVIHKDIYFDFADVFKELVLQKSVDDFVVERMQLIEEYGGDDLKSMLENNSSAFNVRRITGKDNTFSKHSYGLAIDINPFYNPYINGDLILPSEAKHHLDFHYSTSQEEKSNLWTEFHITPQVADHFKRRGFDWGGDWKGVKQDWHHFEIVPPNYLSQISWNITMQEYDAWFQTHVQSDCIIVIGEKRGIQESFAIDLDDGSIVAPLHLSMDTERLRIESVTEKDLNALAHIFAHAPTMESSSLGVLSELQTQQQLSRWLEDWKSHNPFSAYTVREKKQEDFLGFVLLEQNDQNSSTVTLTCVVHQQYAKENIDSELIQLMCGEFAKWAQCFYPLPHNKRRLERIECANESCGSETGFHKIKEGAWSKKVSISSTS